MKCKRLAEGLRAARHAASFAASLAMGITLRTHFQSTGIVATEMFMKLKNPDGVITTSALQLFLSKLPNFEEERMALALAGFPSGVSQLAFLELVQEHQRCKKQIAFTTALDVKEGKAIRKLDVGEVVEVLEAPKTEATSGLDRARCRALADGVEGWVTIRGNQGTAFLERSGKPYYYIAQEAPLEATQAAGGGLVRALGSGEVVELLEGPREDKPGETLRVRVRGSKAVTSGWLTFRDSAGTPFLEKKKVLICKTAIALTSAFDIGDSKVIRKLDVGEMIEKLEEPKEDGALNLLRVRARASCDGKEGWITMHGSKGTVYIEESGEHYISTRSSPLQQFIDSESKVLRTVAEGETLKVLEGPKVETRKPTQRARGRALRDGAEGWLVVGPGAAQEWRPRHRCKRGVAIQDGPDSAKGNALRKLEVGEIVDAVEAPSTEACTGMVRMRVRADRDGMVGYVSVRGSDGAMFLESVAQ